MIWSEVWRGETPQLLTGHISSTPPWCCRRRRARLNKSTSSNKFDLEGEVLHLGSGETWGLQGAGVGRRRRRCSVRKRVLTRTQQTWWRGETNTPDCRRSGRSRHQEGAESSSKHSTGTFWVCGAKNRHFYMFKEAEITYTELPNTIVLHILEFYVRGIIVV